MRLDLLQALRDFLATKQDHEVNIAVLRNETKCGTLACGMGWAPSVPLIAQEGLAFSVIHRNFSLKNRGFLHYVEAAEATFGITAVDAYDLFSNPGDAGFGTRDRAFFDSMVDNFNPSRDSKALLLHRLDNFIHTHQ